MSTSVYRPRRGHPCAVYIVAGNGADDTKQWEIMAVIKTDRDAQVTHVCNWLDWRNQGDVQANKSNQVGDKILMTIGTRYHEAAARVGLLRQEFTTMQALKHGIRSQLERGRRATL